MQFPDLEDCLSSGNTIEETYNNAKEALRLYLDTDNDSYNREFKNASSIDEIIKKNKKEIVMLIEYDSIEYIN